MRRRSRVRGLIAASALLVAGGMLCGCGSQSSVVDRCFYASEKDQLSAWEKAKVTLKGYTKTPAGKKQLIDRCFSLVTTGDSARIRIRAMEFLNELDHARALQAATEALKDEDQMVAFAARDLLAQEKHPDSKTRETIETLLLSEKQEQQYCAATILAAWGDKKSAQTLVDALQDKTAENAPYYLFDLLARTAEAGNPVALKKAAACLKSEKMIVRLAALRLLRQGTGKDFPADPARWEKALQSRES